MEQFNVVNSNFFDGYVPVTADKMLSFLNPTKRTETVKAMESVLKAKESKSMYKAKETLTSSDFLATALITQRELDTSAPFPEDDPMTDVTKITSLKTVSDFNTIELYRTEETGDLDEVQPGEDYASTSFTDAKDTAKIKKYGKIFPMTMEQGMNDVLGIFADLPNKLIRSAQRTKIKQIVGVFAGNATLFNAGNDNVLTTSPLNQENLEKALTLISNQTDANGNKLNLRGATLVVPTSLQFTAERLVKPLIAAIAAGSMDNGVTSFKLDLLVLPWLEDYSSDNWYVFADPNIYPAITRLEMRGMTGPQLFMKQSDAIALANAGGSITESFNNDTIQMKVRLLHNSVTRRYQAGVYATKA